MKNLISNLTLVTVLVFTASAIAETAEKAKPHDDREKAAEIMRQMLPPEVVAGMEGAQPATGFGKELSRLAYENAYLQLWTRPGLSLEERSLVTISMLIALGNEKELAYHVASGLRNGLSIEQIEEVIYQATAYVGFPRASQAHAVAAEVIAKESQQAGDTRNPH